MMIDEIVSLKRDAFVYRALTQKFSEKRRENTSSYSEKKVRASFADDASNIPILKYKSKVVAGPSVFGAVAQIDKGTIFMKPVDLKKVLDQIDSQEYAPSYNLEELVDPLLFEEWLNIYSKLKMKHIAWLATHRTRRHTFSCVCYDWNLWRFHINRIFQKLLEIQHSDDSSRVYLRGFVEKEIDEAAKDARQAIDKILNKDAARYRVIQWMEALARTYPLALRIRQTIEPLFQVNSRVIMMAKIRRCFTTILRRYLSSLRLASDKRTVGTPMDSYLNRLKKYCLELEDRWKGWAENVDRALQIDEPRSTLKELYTLFTHISLIEDFECWFDNKQLLLDQWVTKEDKL